MQVLSYKKKTPSEISGSFLFAALPAGVLDALLLPENKEILVKILTYHVVSGMVMAADVTDGEE